MAAVVGSITLPHAVQSRDRVRALRALALAEAGAAHALALVRGPLANVSKTRILAGNDSAGSTADDGILSGMGISVADQLPSAGITLSTGTYTVRVVDDPADSATGAFLDGNGKVMARCRGVTLDGGVAEVDVVIGGLGMPAIVINGVGNVSGNPYLLGACGGMHANGNLSLGGTTTSSGPVSSSGSVLGGKKITPAAGGAEYDPKSGAPSIAVPIVTAASHCASGVLTLSASGVATFGGSSYTATSSYRYGWIRTSTSPVMWSFDPVATSTPAHMPGATVCVTGNVLISGDVGTAATPYAMSIFATGSIDISGNPFLKPAKPGWLVMAEGDVSLSGNSSVTPAFAGMVYARSQCKISGDPRFSGQVMCRNEADGAGDKNLTDENLISGSPTITNSCSGPLSSGAKVVNWSRRF